MKKRIVSVISWLLAVAMLVSLPVCAFAADDNEEESPSVSWSDADTYVKTLEAVNYYTSYLDEEETGVWPVGTVFTIKRTADIDGNTWWEVALDSDSVYYVKQCSVNEYAETADDYEDPDIPTGSTADTVDSGLSSGVISHTSSVNVRSEPTTFNGYNIVGTIKPGTEVTIYEKVQNATTKKWWARIGVDEWVCMDYVKETSASTDTDSESGTGTTGTPKCTGVVVNCTKLNVRASASISADLKGTLAVGTEVSIYEIVTKNGVEWGRIGTDQWVSLQYVQITETNSDDTSDDSTTTESIIATGTVTSNVNLNVRTGAGTNFPIKTSLVKGTTINIYATKTVNGVEWGRIASDDQWVCLSYVNIDSGSIDSGSAANATIVNCSKAVNVRATPSVSGALVSQISLNTRVYISDTQKASNGVLWGKVDNGWVCMDYVQMDSETDTGDSSSTVSTTTGASYANITVPAAVTAGEEAIVYVNADTSSERLVVLYGGAKISITGRALVDGKQWGKVSVSGYTGWVNMENITLDVISATVSTAQLTVYDEPSTDGNQVVIWGKGQAATITYQYTDGTYLWGKVSESNEEWVNMASLSIISDSDSSETSDSSSATISIAGTVNVDETVVYEDAGSDEKILALVKNTKITIVDLQVSDDGTVWGKITLENITTSTITGWVEMDDITQTSVSGTISADTAPLYLKVGGSVSSLELEKNNSVTILERTKDAGGTIWGKVKISSAYYWIKMSQVTLNSTGSTGTSDSSTTDSSSSSSVTGVVNYTYLNVRSQPSATSELITQLKLGDKVTVYEQTTSNGAVWGRIDQGWVAMQYINLSSTASSTGTTVSNSTIMTTVPSGAIAVGFVNYDGLTIRSGAGLGYDKVGTLSKGTNVVITEQKLTGGMIWGKIDKGWICTSYVTMTGASITGSGSTGTIARCAYTVNVRSDAGVGNALVAKLLVNSRVEILETKIYSGEQWGRTSLGWISMQYVLMDN